MRILFVGDIVDAIVLAAASAGAAGEVFQIATNTETTVLELAERLANVLRRHGVILAGIHHGGPRVGDVKRNFSDTRKAQSRLGWSARVGLEDGLERTVKWFLNERSV